MNEIYRIVYFDVAAIIISIVMLFSLFFRKMLKGRTNKLFIYLALAVLLSASFDLLAEAKFSNQLVNFRFAMKELYFIFRNITLPIYFVFLISVTGLWKRFRDGYIFKLYVLIMSLLPVVLMLLNSFTGIIFTIDLDPAGSGQYIYARHDFIWLLYALGIANMLVGIIFLIKYHHSLMNDQLISLLLMFILNIVAVVIQMLFPILIVETFATAIAFTIIPITINRPEMINQTLFSKNSKAFEEFITLSYNVKKHMHIIFVRIENYETLVSSLTDEKYMRLIVMFLKKVKKESKNYKIYFEPYTLGLNEAALVFEDSEKVDKKIEFAKSIKGYLNELYEFQNVAINIDSKVSLVETVNDIKDGKTIIHYMKSVNSFLPDSKDAIIYKDIASSKSFRLRTQLDAIIDKALENKEFMVYYQPVYSVKENRYVACEALLRLPNYEYGYIDPELIIERAEANGKIHEIGEYVITKIFEFISSDEFKNLGLKQIDVNISMVQLLEPDFPQRISKLCDKNHIDHKFINFEIPENFQEGDDSADTNIFRLRQENFTTTLDGYGNGCSNIMKIGTLPIDYVKLDRALATDIRNEDMVTIISNTIGMLKELNLKVCGVGIEMPRVLEIFKEFGCDYLQGFYFSKALSEREFINFMQKNNDVKVIQ